MEKYYGPNIRISDETDKYVKKARKETHSNIPSPKSNPIVVNNIASQEFDYTEDPLKK